MLFTTFWDNIRSAKILFAYSNKFEWKRSRNKMIFTLFLKILWNSQFGRTSNWYSIGFETNFYRNVSQNYKMTLDKRNKRGQKKILKIKRNAESLWNTEYKLKDNQHCHNFELDRQWIRCDPIRSEENEIISFFRSLPLFLSSDKQFHCRRYTLSNTLWMWTVDWLKLVLLEIF